jgi:hypothetical protein
MTEMLLILPVWMLLLILSLLVLVIARMAEERQAYWVVIELIVFLCAFWMWFFAPEMVIVI